MGNTFDLLETQRLTLQSQLEATKTQAERNRLGQFATPTSLAVDILEYAARLFPKQESIHFLDPAIGSGAFYSALRNVFPEDQLVEALGFEIDPDYAKAANRLWGNSGLVIKHADFTNEEPMPRFNLLICNPPYVRHHHLQNGDKARLRFRTAQASGMKLSGLAGLYCHFLGLSRAWMTDDGLAGWLIPSEFMDVNYGRSVKDYLLNKVALLHIHRFDPKDSQFADALVSSTVVWFRKRVPPQGHVVTFTFGGTLLNPKLVRKVPAKTLAHESKWSRFPIEGIRTNTSTPTISDFFQIKRGIATGNNKYFILKGQDIAARRLPFEMFHPILPSPRYIQADEVRGNANGFPLLPRQLFVLDSRLSEEQIKERFPALFEYLQEGKAQGVPDRYICRNRTPWYAQEHRPPAPIVCTYLGRGDSKRGRPFRFILNQSNATVANVYLAMYPKPLLARRIKTDPMLIRRIWEILNTVKPEQLIGEGRVYGGGLYKLEPQELGKVEATAISDLMPDFKRPITNKQLGFFEDIAAISVNASALR